MAPSSLSASTLVGRQAAVTPRPPELSLDRAKRAASKKALLKAEKQAAARAELLEASRTGDDERLQALLLTPGALQQTDRQGNTPLHRAAAFGHSRCTQLLLLSNASVEAKGQYGWSPIETAAANGHLTVALVLLSFPEALKSGASRALHLAAAAGHVPIVRVLLRHGVEVDATDETGSTALHVAAGRGQLAAVRCLLEAGASLTVRDGAGCSAMDVALGTGQCTQELPAMLRSAGRRAEALKELRAASRPWGYCLCPVEPARLKLAIARAQEASAPPDALEQAKEALRQAEAFRELAEGRKARRKAQLRRAAQGRPAEARLAFLEAYRLGAPAAALVSAANMARKDGCVEAAATEYAAALRVTGERALSAEARLGVERRLAEAQAEVATSVAPTPATPLQAGVIGPPEGGDGGT